MSPRSKEQVERIREQSRDNILESGLALFAGRGYRAATISAIAKEAGVSKGLLYNYFESKEALLRAIVQQAVDMGEDLIAQHPLEGKEDPRQILITLIDIQAERLQKHTKYCQLLLQLSQQQEVKEQLNDLLKSTVDHHIHYLEGLFAKMEVEDPFGQGLLFAAALDGIAMQYLQMVIEYPLEQVLDQLKKRFDLT